MTPLYTTKISRRTTLKWLAAATAAPSVLHSVLACTPKAAAPAPVQGYGTDPDLIHPTVPWPRTMTAHQIQATAVLADLILPGSESSPAPSALGIPDFVDEWISAPYPEQRADRTTILGGLQWLDAEARRRWQRGFLAVHDHQRQQLVEAIVLKSHSAATTATATAQETFFRRFRYVVVGAYYTTPEGFKDIGYIGNVPLPSYPPVTDKERAILEAELRKLGL